MPTDSNANFSVIECSLCGKGYSQHYHYHLKYKLFIYIDVIIVGIIPHHTDKPNRIFMHKSKHHTVSSILQ